MIDAQERYAQARAELQTLQAAPVKDLPAIDRIIDELEQLQLLIKETHGLKGNNPNE